MLILSQLVYLLHAVLKCLINFANLKQKLKLKVLIIKLLELEQWFLRQVEKLRLKQDRLKINLIYDTRKFRIMLFFISFYKKGCNYLFLKIQPQIDFEYLDNENFVSFYMVTWNAEPIIKQSLLGLVVLYDYCFIPKKVWGRI